jgi:hypothetical protein
MPVDGSVLAVVLLFKRLNMGFEGLLVWNITGPSQAAENLENRQLAML